MNQSPPIRWLLVVGMGCAAVLAALLLRAGPDTLSGIPRAELGPIPVDAHYVSPTGSDSNVGTATAPWRSLGRAVAAAEPGDTVVLRPGTYGAAGEVTRMNRPGSPGDPITFRGDPSAARPRIIGHVRITAPHQRFNHLLFDGPTGRTKAITPENPGGEQVQVSIMGAASGLDDVEISDCEVRDSAWHAGIYVDAEADIRLIGNYVHDNGDRSDPGQENLSHGIYWSSGSGLIAGNVVEHNVARGVQLYPSASDVLVANNTIVDNGKAGVQVGGDSSGVSIVNNIVADNGDRGIRSSGLTGSDNEAVRNLLWANLGDGSVTDDLPIIETIEEAPLFADSSYELESESPAVDGSVEVPAGETEPEEGMEPLGDGFDLGARESW